jgi:hypothetical protein
MFIRIKPSLSTTYNIQQVVNPLKRFTADKALAHPWCGADDAVLEVRNMRASLDELRKFQASKKLKAGIKAVQVGFELILPLSLCHTLYCLYMFLSYSLIYMFLSYCLFISFSYPLTFFSPYTLSIHDLSYINTLSVILLT